MSCVLVRFANHFSLNDFRCSENRVNVHLCTQMVCPFVFTQLSIGAYTRNMLPHCGPEQTCLHFEVLQLL